jgi:hypothetical protein
MEEFEDIKPGIGESGKRNSFEVPPGYFEDFSGRLHERMTSLENPMLTRAGRKILRPAFAYIAGICLLVIAVITISKALNSSHSPIIPPQQAMANLVQYSLENIDEQTIIDGLNLNEIDSVSNEITKEDVLKYIQDHNIDASSLIEEL